MLHVGKGRAKWYAEHPCEHRFKALEQKGYCCATLKEACFRALERGVCPQGYKLPLKPETFTLEPGMATVTIPRDIPAGTYVLRKVS